MSMDRPVTVDPIRRNLFRLMFVGVAGVIAPAATTAAGIKFLWGRDVSAPQVNAGRIEDYTVGDMVLFEEGEFYMARLPDRFMAINQRSTYMRCKVAWDPESREFASSCDGSRFDDKGEVVRGPAPRPLGTHTITVENGELIVEVGDENVRKRDRYEPGQGASVG